MSRSRVIAASAQPRSGSGVSGQMIADQPQLAVARGRQRQPVEKAGEVAHQSGSSSNPTRCSGLAGTPFIAHQRTSASSRPCVTQTSDGRELGDGRGQRRPVAMVRQDQRQLDAALPLPRADLHPAARERDQRIGEPPHPLRRESRRRPEHDGAGEIRRLAAFKRGVLQRSRGRSPVRRNSRTTAAARRAGRPARRIPPRGSD